MRIRIVNPCGPTPNNLTSIGLQNGEAIGSVTLAVSGNGGATDAPVGAYIITPSQATGGTFTPANYNIGYNTGTLTVTPSTNSIPVTIVGVTRLADGTVQLNFTGTPGNVYMIEAATNLTSPIGWTTLGTNTADTNGVFSFTDLSASNYNFCYYRTATQSTSYYLFPNPGMTLVMYRVQRIAAQIVPIRF